MRLESICREWDPKKGCRDWARLHSTYLINSTVDNDATGFGLQTSFRVYLRFTLSGPVRQREAVLQHAAPSSIAALAQAPDCCRPSTIPATQAGRLDSWKVSSAGGTRKRWCLSDSIWSLYNWSGEIYTDWWPPEWNIHLLETCVDTGQHLYWTVVLQAFMIFSRDLIQALKTYLAMARPQGDTLLMISLPKLSILRWWRIPRQQLLVPSRQLVRLSHPEHLFRQAPSSR